MQLPRWGIVVMTFDVLWLLCIVSATYLLCTSIGLEDSVRVTARFHFSITMVTHSTL